MRSQWECLLQNLGEWQGSFTRFSPQGEQLEDTPTVVSLEGLDNNQTIRQTIRRFSPGQSISNGVPADEKVLEYSSLGRGVLFFETGAFSQGSIQLGPFSEFGAELGLTDGSRRLRLVQLFNREGQIDRLTLIREKLPNAEVIEHHPLTLDDLLGEWQGEAITLYPDWRSPSTFPTLLKLERQGNDRLQQQTSFGEGPDIQTITSTAAISSSNLRFDQSNPAVQVLLLPDGASATYPLQVTLGHAFFLEVGWLVQPDLRQRMIRSYNSKGEWVSLTLVTERKVLTPP